MSSVLARSAVLALVMLAISACGASVAERASVPVPEPRLYGIDLAPEGIHFAFSAEVAAVRGSALHEPIHERLEAVADEEFLRLVYGSDRLHAFATIGNGYVFVAEGANVAAFIEARVSEGDFIYDKQVGEVFAYHWEHVKMAYRAPDTLMMAGPSKDGHVLSPEQWDAQLARLAGHGPAAENTALRALLASGAIDGAAASFGFLWPKEMTAKALADADDPEMTERLLGKFVGLGGSFANRDGFQVHVAIEGQDPSLAHLGNILVPHFIEALARDAEPKAAATLRGTQAQVEENTLHVKLEVAAEQLEAFTAFIAAKLRELQQEDGDEAEAPASAPPASETPATSAPEVSRAPADAAALRVALASAR